MTINRRKFLRNCSAISAGLLGLSIAGYRGLRTHPLRTKGYGDLVSDPEGILDLPKGFSYKVISRVGNKMSDGFVTPGLPDGMATFEGENERTILIRNHEQTPNHISPFGKKNELLKNINALDFYDYGNGKQPCIGGTTTIVFNTKTQEVELDYLSLAGTVRNCAGGPTPWNTWITCEETVLRKGDHDKFILDKDHGYNFEVPASSTIKLADPVPLKAMGRFNHEAIAIDPATGIVYQTEDRGDGLIYRFIPKVNGQLQEGGKLQALKLKSGLSDLRNWTSTDVLVGEKHAVEWIDMDNVEAPDDDLRRRGSKAGAAIFARGEGMWHGEDGIYFACTNGGEEKLGQIWRYSPGPNEGDSGEDKQPGQLELFVEPNNSELVHNADNLTAAPWGDLMVCEDRKGDVIRVVGVTPEGKLYNFAHSHLDTEFAGATFSPDGSTFFVNSQGTGHTFAITGPWESRIS